MAITQPTNLKEFDEVLKGNKFVVTDFFADWCPPCKAIAPHYAKLATDLSVPEGFAFTKVNVDSAPDIAARYGITAMPSFLFFENGQPYGDKSLIRGANMRALLALTKEISDKVPKADAKVEAKADAPVEAKPSPVEAKTSPVEAKHSPVESSSTEPSIA